MEPIRKSEGMLPKVHFGALIGYSLLIFALASVFGLVLIKASLRIFSLILPLFNQASVQALQGTLEEAVHSDALGSGVQVNFLLGFSIVAYFAVAFSTFLVAKLSDPQNTALRLGLRSWQIDLRFWQLLGGIFLYGLVAGVVVSWLVPDAENWMIKPTDVWGWIMLLFIASFLGPASEELFFRGWLYTGLRTRMGFMPAALFTSALFALAHFDRTLMYATTIFPIGFVLGYVRERYSSIKASSLMHGLYNFALLIVFYLTQGL